MNNKQRLELLAYDLVEMAKKIKELDTENIDAVCELIGEMQDLRTDIKNKGIVTLENIEHELTYK